MNDVKGSTTTAGWRFVLIIMVLASLVFLTINASASKVNDTIPSGQKASFANISGIYI